MQHTRKHLFYIYVCICICMYVCIFVTLRRKSSILNARLIFFYIKKHKKKIHVQVILPSLVIVQVN